MCLWMLYIGIYLEMVMMVKVFVCKKEMESIIVKA